MNELIQYVRKNVKGKRQIVGVLYAGKIYENGMTIHHIGWSKAATNKGDKFNKQVGLNIAIGRSQAQDRDALPAVPNSFREDITAFEHRCQRYFKDAMFCTVLTIRQLGVCGMTLVDWYRLRCL